MIPYIHSMFHTIRKYIPLPLQYVLYKVIADSFIKRTISLQSSPILKHLHMFDIIDTTFSYEKELIFC